MRLENMADKKKKQNTAEKATKSRVMKEEKLKEHEPESNTLPDIDFKKLLGCGG
jgi:hypothetical protein